MGHRTSLAALGIAVMAAGFDARAADTPDGRRRWSHVVILADINIDMILPLYPLKKLTMFGSDESDLGDDAAAVARSLGVLPRPDPMPEHNVFIRSDQYSFIRRGIPSLMVMVGFDKGSPEEQIVMSWHPRRG